VVGLVVLLLVREEGPDDVSKLGRTDRGIAEQIEGVTYPGKGRGYCK